MQKRVHCINYFDSNKRVVLRTGGLQRKIDYLQIYTQFSCNLSILLVENILVLDKSRKLVSCVKVYFENKKQMFLRTSIQFFIDAWELLLIERRGMHYDEVYMYGKKHFVFI